MSSSSSSLQTHEVRLAIYDLSRGMARTLSGQFLGPSHAIDIIPHTALIVYGREYFFGGGIQSTVPSEFRNSMQIFPIEEQTLGRTSVSQVDFERWCTLQMQSGEWTAASYDLLHRNCNNFSHEAALHGLHLPKGVPDWILQVPQTFLSSPMGQMIRPMLEQMQVTGPQHGSSSSSSFAPFANAPTATTARTTSSTPSTPSTSSSNPWANIPNQTTVKNTKSNTHTGKNNNTNQNNVDKTSSTRTTLPIQTPVLESHNRPLLSSDTKAVGVCLSKLLEKITNETDQFMLKQISVMLLAKKDVIPQTIVQGSCEAIWNHLNQSDNSDHDNGKGIVTTIVFTLMLLRLIVLHPPLPTRASTANNKRTDSGDVTKEMPSFDESNKSYFDKCMDWVENHLANEENNNDTTQKSLFSSPAARSMLWCTAGNAYSKDTCTIKLIDNAVEAAMSDLSPQSQSRVEVRQAAAAFLYNVAHSQQQQQQQQQQVHPSTVHNITTDKVEQEQEQEELSDLSVSLLCGALDGIIEEKDETVLLRRLLIAGKLLQSSANTNVGATEGGVSKSAKNLIIDLGFVDGLSSIISETGDEGIDKHNDKQSTKLAKELQSLIEA